LNGIPHIQTLREFPREELFGKVVMVRFDSNILLKQECNQKNQSDFNALLTIKYLHEAGAKVILVSDWTNPSELCTKSVAVAGTFVRAFLKLTSCLSFHIKQVIISIL
jgi:phosphoglycerate kinase